MTKRLQRQRFEYKYLVRESTARAIRDFVSGYLDLDEYGARQPDLAYPVHSLYLDSRDLLLYRNTINGDRNRFKLRIRFYESATDRPVYLEIKRRANNVILKKRAAVGRADVSAVLAGQLPAPDRLPNDSVETAEALESFISLVNRLGAAPQVHVSYLREAWVSRVCNGVRITMDRYVRTERRRRLSLDPDMIRAMPVFDGQVVLELKFTNRFPAWFGAMVRTFGLRQGSAAKYVDGVYRMGERGLMSAYL